MGEELSTVRERYRGIDRSFGEKPKVAWAVEGVIEAKEGSIAYEAQNETAEFGVPSFVISDAVWEKSGKSAPAFVHDGQIYFKENLPEESRKMFVPHEMTHMMKQKLFEPYIGFVKRTPEILNIRSDSFQVLINTVAEHGGIDLFNLDDASFDKLYDELNATMYGHIAAGKVDAIGAEIYNAFNDFDAYAS